MPLLIVKVTVLFIAALIALATAKRATAGTRHLLCVSALAGSLLIPVAALFPAKVMTIRLPLIDAVSVSQNAARAGSWSSLNFTRLMIALWAAGCISLLIRLAIGHWRIARIVRVSTPIQPGIYIANVSVPIVSGLFRPAVLMPRSSAEWPEWQFDAAIRHERMHLFRHDLEANFIAQLACAFWWFHPLGWMLASCLRDNQETACDDAVLCSGFEPATYAEALLAVSQTSTPTLLPGFPMTTQTNLKNRIIRLLDNSIARTTSRTNHLRTIAACAIFLGAISLVSPSKSSAQSQSPPDKPGQVFKVGGDVTQPHVIYKVDPAYTEEARQAKISGAVMLSVTVGADGLAHDISIVKSLDPGLDRNAAEILQQWRFAPGTLKGEPVAVRATIEINFRLN